MRLKLALVALLVSVGAGCTTPSTESEELSRMESAESRGSELIAAAMGPDAVTSWERDLYLPVFCPGWCIGEYTAMDLGTGHPLAVLDLIVEQAEEFEWAIKDRAQATIEVNGEVSETGWWDQRVVATGDIELELYWTNGDLKIRYTSAPFTVEPHQLTVVNPCDFDITTFWWTNAFRERPQISDEPDVLLVSARDSAAAEDLPRGTGLILIPELGWTEQYSMEDGSAVADPPLTACGLEAEPSLARARVALEQTITDLLPTPPDVEITARTKYCPPGEVAMTWSVYYHDNPEVVVTVAGLGSYWEKTMGAQTRPSQKPNFRTMTAHLMEVILEASELDTGGFLAITAYSPCFKVAGSNNGP